MFQPAQRTDPQDLSVWRWTFWGPSSPDPQQAVHLWTKDAQLHMHINMNITTKPSEPPLLQDLPCTPPLEPPQRVAHTGQLSLHRGPEWDILLCCFSSLLNMLHPL